MDPHRARRIGKELQVELSSTGHSLYFHGTSMQPFLREGDLIIVRPVSWNKLQPGHIITYRDGDKFPTRRIFKKHAGQLSLRCDGWKKRAFTAAPEDILGRAEARCRDQQWITISGPEWRRATRQAMTRASVRAWRKRIWPFWRRKR